MNNNFIWLVLIELLIIVIIVIIKIVVERHEKKKVEKILNYFDKKAKENAIYKKRVDILKQIVAGKNSD